MAGLGGFIGAGLRYAITAWLQQPGQVRFPWATLAVNVIGCLLIGVLYGLIESRDLFSAHMRTLLLVGVIGGFTTYSTFAFEALMLARQPGLWRPLAYIGLHLVVGLAAVWSGHRMTS